MSKAPFKTLFSNDNTNILTCISPYHREGEDFGPEMLQATVDETADTGIDVHMLQPGMGWAPFWQSDILRPREHYRWFTETFDTELDSYARYLIEGGDMIKVFVERCRQKGLTPFISYRLNDAHSKNMIYGSTAAMPGHTAHGLSKSEYDHPEFQLGPNAIHPEFSIFDGPNYFQGVQNWQFRQVREYKFNFIEEICRNYDIDGLELDFLRFFSFFAVRETTPAERIAIMTSFVNDVRQVLDQTAKPGQKRWLCVRIPCYLEAHIPLGIDVPEFSQAGVDMFNLSAHYFTNQENDFKKIRQLAPDKAMYLEVTQTTATGAYSGKERLTTDEQFYTTAHLAYRADLDGISTFNLHYYRKWPAGNDVRDKGADIPFHVFRNIADKDWVAKQPQHYFLGNTFMQPPLGPTRQLPRDLGNGQSTRFEIQCAAPAASWKHQGRLRIQSNLPFGPSIWDAKLNGNQLKPTDNTSEPYPNPYPTMLGSKHTLRAWIVNPETMKNGVNDLELTLVKGHHLTVTFIDLAVS